MRKILLLIFCLFIINHLLNVYIFERRDHLKYNIKDEKIEKIVVKVWSSDSHWKYIKNEQIYTLDLNTWIYIKTSSWETITNILNSWEYSINPYNNLVYIKDNMLFLNNSRYLYKNYSFPSFFYNFYWSKNWKYLIYKYQARRCNFLFCMWLWEHSIYLFDLEKHRIRQYLYPKFKNTNIIDIVWISE